MTMNNALICNITQYRVLQGVMGSLYLLLEETGGESFAAYKEFGRQIVVAALSRVRHTHSASVCVCLCCVVDDSAHHSL